MSKSLSKGGAGPLFYVTSALVTLLITASIRVEIYHWIGICMLMLFSVSLPRWFNHSLLSLVVVVFFAVLTINITLLTRDNISAGYFLVVSYLLSYLIFSQVSIQQTLKTFKVIIGIFCLLSCWGIYQYLTGRGYIIAAFPRSNTVFHTANSFAAGLNLVLLPTMVLYLFGKENKLCLWPGLLLFTALLTTVSRGGYLAFSLTFLLILLAPACSRLSMDRQRLKKLFAGMLFCILIFMTISPGGGIVSSGNNYLNISTRALEPEGVSTRLHFYHIAWQGIKATPVIGEGFYHYQYLFERYKNEQNAGRSTGFVHNDYLQLWLELGTVGLLAFLAIITIAFLRVLPHVINRHANTVFLMTILAGTITFLLHAMVDFLFYVPAIGFLFFAYLGAVDRITASPSGQWTIINKIERLSKKAGLRLSVIKAVIFVVIGLSLLQPALADRVYIMARLNPANLDNVTVLKLYNLCRTLNPGKSEYHWAEGVHLFKMALQDNTGDRMDDADKLFSKGIEINPYNVDNWLARAVIHRDYPEMLTTSSTLDETIGWLDYVLLWQPHNTKAHVEYLWTLRKMGRNDEAENLYRDLISRYPESKYLRRYHDKLSVS